MSISKALEKLGFDPINDFTLQDDGDGVYIKEWNSNQSPPTEAEIETAHAEWQADYDSKAYARNRQAEYPSMDEIVVALWEAVIEERMASSIDLQGKRAAVKDKYPKP